MALGHVALVQESIERGWKQVDHMVYPLRCLQTLPQLVHHLMSGAGCVILREFGELDVGGHLIGLITSFMVKDDRV